MPRHFALGWRKVHRDDGELLTALLGSRQDAHFNKESARRPLVGWERPGRADVANQFEERCSFALHTEISTDRLRSQEDGNFGVNLCRLHTKVELSQLDYQLDELLHGLTRWRLSFL